MLVVEDEPRVRKLTVTRLRTLGYRVLEAANGPAALDLLRAAPDVDFVFTDLVMPGGMTGADLARQIYADPTERQGAVYIGLCGTGTAQAGPGTGCSVAEKAVHRDGTRPHSSEIFDAGLA